MLRRVRDAAHWPLALLPLCLASLACAEAPQPLAHWSVRTGQLPASVLFWCGDVVGLEASATAEPDAEFPDGRGAIAVRVASSPQDVTTALQLCYLSGESLGEGGGYRVSFWLRASGEASIEAAVLGDAAPWASVGGDQPVVFTARTEWQHCQLDIVATRDCPPDVKVRAPYLGLGRVAAGTTVWVAGVTLSEVAPPPPPLPLLRSEELLANPGFEEGLAGWSPQAASLEASRVGPRSGGVSCLVTGRTARWGTPSQDIRGALLAHGPGFYEFGGCVRTAQGAGEAFAVIHLRDSGGDRWLTSETRPTGDAAYTRLETERHLAWTGALEAADIGIQTAEGDMADVLVDDLSLRALSDLARGRTASSSGDAPGGSAAHACDGDPETVWQPASVADAWLEVDLGEPVAFNACVLRERGSRIRSYLLEAWDGERWIPAFTGGEVLGGLDRLHFPPVHGTKARLRITRAEAPPELAELSLHTTRIRETTVRIPPPPADAARRGERTLVGAIRWDGWCGDLSPVGLGLEAALSPARYRERLPFYATVTEPGHVEIRCTTQEVMDREIAFAKEAGIDYWAFDWYPPDDGLATARRLYLSSAHRADVKWCIILGTADLPDPDRRWLVDQFATSNYQKVLGDRPLVYIFNASRAFAPLVQKLREECAAVGCPTPFIVFMGWGSAIAEAAVQSGADALGAYVNPFANRTTFAENMAHERRQWEALRATGRQLVPTVTTGWDPRPFLDHPVPWYPGATESNWVEAATPEQIAEQLREALALERAHPEATVANAVLIYAWNENAEGGWLVPSLAEVEGGMPARLDAVRGVLRPDVPRGSGWGRLMPPTGGTTK